MSIEPSLAVSLMVISVLLLYCIVQSSQYLIVNPYCRSICLQISVYSYPVLYHAYSDQYISVLISQLCTIPSSMLLYIQQSIFIYTQVCLSKYLISYTSTDHLTSILHTYSIYLILTMYSITYYYSILYTLVFYCYFYISFILYTHLTTCIILTL